MDFHKRSEVLSDGYLNIGNVSFDFFSYYKLHIINFSDTFYRRDTKMMTMYCLLVMNELYKEKRNI